MSIEVEVGGVYEQASDLTPAGSIIAFGGTIAPSGWYLCDGSTKSRTTDQRLFDVIGTNFGDGDGGGNTFSLPDLQGVFLRGIDKRTIAQGCKDPDSADRRNIHNEAEVVGPVVGSYQEDSFEIHQHNHKHDFTIVKAWDRNNPYIPAGSNEWDQPRTGSTSYTAADPSSGRTSTETRVKNIGVNYIIKN